jgi:hypothetical protein
VEYHILAAPAEIEGNARLFGIWLPNYLRSFKGISLCLKLYRQFLSQLDDYFVFKLCRLRRVGMERKE